MALTTNLNAWLHQHAVTPLWLCDRLELPRETVSGLLAGAEPITPLIGYALEGISHEIGGPQRTGRAPSAPRGPLRGRMSGDTWSERTARLAMPILVERALGRKGTITYGDLHDAVVSVGAEREIGRMTKYAFVLGHIATAVSEIDTAHAPVPPLTALVVNARTGVPSHGINAFVTGYCHAVGRGADARAIELDEGSAKRREAFERVWDDIQSFPAWRTIQSECGLTGRADFDR